MRTALLIRHGAVGDGAEERFLGAADLPMSPAGEAQVRELAARLRLRAIPDAIYCSDLSRSLRTAELLADESAIPIRVRPALREIEMGDWQGLSRREIAERRPEDYAARGRDIANFRPPGGESFADLVERVLPCWRELVEDRETQVVAIAGHAGVNRVILCHLLGAPLANLFRIAQRLACVNVVEWRKNEPVVTLIDGERL
ncbi:MAG: histidine phosphatase family protein [Roseiarcus sp.]|jgi:probable phosphoglycerate mutase|uniref:histidine phosphatase family protein n=1 Tax=Roseiarcus sp. TaxID=1969460 RepID=UPI003C29E1B8